MHYAMTLTVELEVTDLEGRSSDLGGAECIFLGRILSEERASCTRPR